MDETGGEEEKVLHQTQSCGQGELQIRCRNEPKEILFTDVAVRWKKDNLTFPIFPNVLSPLLKENTPFVVSCVWECMFPNF